MALFPVLSGCGLVLDLAPPEQGVDGAIDAAGIDGGTAGPCESDSECADDDICNGVERCTRTGCQPGVPTVCDDGVDCTVDVCDPLQGCSPMPDSGLCTEFAGGRCDPLNDCQYAMCDQTTCTPSPCTTAMCMPDGTCVRPSICSDAEMCCGTACVPLACDDDNSCTTDTCHEGTSQCDHVPTADVLCDDFNPCSRASYCDPAGDCVGDTSCDDANPCTADSCSATGCNHVALTGATCSDGDPCTTDLCITSPGSAVPTCQSRPMCDDGQFCTTDSCVVDPGGLAVCRAPANLPNGTICPTGTCQSGQCTNFSGCIGRANCDTSSDDCECVGFCDPTAPGSCASCTNCGIMLCLATERCCPCGGCVEAGTACPSPCPCPTGG